MARSSARKIHYWPITGAESYVRETVKSTNTRDLDETAGAHFSEFRCWPVDAPRGRAPTGVDLSSGFDGDLYYLP